MIKLHWSVINTGKSGQASLTLSEASQTEWLIGRSDRCDLTLPDPHVSTTHAKIVFSNGEFYLIDLNSSNSTSLNGEKISPNKAYPLRINDVVHLGVLTSVMIDELQPLQNSQPLGQAQAVWTAEPLNVYCCRVVEETPDTKSFVFAGERGERFDFLPGQFAMLELKIDGQKVLRPYSISSAPLSHLIEFTIKRVPSASPDFPPGVVSNWISNQMQVGDVITLRGGPKGDFTCGHEIPPKLLLISAGSGITPMMSMLRWIYNTPWSMQINVIFLHVARTPKDISFRTELEWMSERMPNLRLLFTITRPESGVAWSGLTGRLSEQLMQLTVPDLSERSTFVCGPNAMMQDTKQIFTALNFPMEHYHEESFGDSGPVSSPTSELSAIEASDADSRSSGASTNSKTATASITTQAQAQASMPESNEPAAPDTAATVKFTQTKKKVQVEGEQTILNAADEAGATIDFRCCSGRCGACKIRINGTVEYRSKQPDPAVLSEQDEKDGYALACVAYAVGLVEVEA